MPTRAVAYIRVSTEDQADHGVSLDAQRARVAAFAKASGLELVDVVVDAGLSAKTLERPGLQRALAMLGAGADALLVVKLDRLTRSLADWCSLLEKYFMPGKFLLRSTQDHVDTATASGRFTLAILFALAEMERAQIGERTSSAMQHKAKSGDYTGGAAPYGYRVGPDGERLELEPAEQAVITAANGLRSQGLSIRAVAAQLEQLGHRSRLGKPFAPGQVQRMLAAEVAATP